MEHLIHGGLKKGGERLNNIKCCFKSKECIKKIKNEKENYYEI
jgi:hypothetical protein